jgi:dihydroneopterin aldolase
MERPDQIRLTGIQVTATHGVYATEKVTPQLFVIDLTCDLRPRTQADDLATTVDYSVLAQRVAEVVEADSVDLIETLAERVSAACLANPLLSAVEVTVHKPQAPLTVPVADVSVTITRRSQL